MALQINDYKLTKTYKIEIGDRLRYCAIRDINRHLQARGVVRKSSLETLSI
jgi:hypothetical protein